MRYFFAVIMLMFSTLALYFSTRIVYNQKYKSPIHCAFSATALGSGLWSLGYSIMFFTNREDIFILFRGIGVTGMFLLLIGGQFLLGITGNLSKKIFNIFKTEAVVGLIVLILNLNPHHITLIETENGIITAFRSQFISIFYTLYTVVVAGFYMGLTIHLLRNKYRSSIRDFARKTLIVECLIAVGMVIDTILPALGVNLNIPASTLLQFVGLELFYIAVHRFERNQITMGNLTAYIYRSLRMPVLIFNENHEMCIVNNQAQALFYLTDQENLENIHFWSGIVDKEQPSHLEKNKETLEMDCFYEKRGLNLRLYVDSIYDEYGDYLGYIIMISDMTDYVKSMEELEKSTEAAMRANKAKSQFLANMSHEIRTPMNSILSFSELAMKEELASDIRDYFSDIHDSAEALLAVINDILDISKIESGKMELVNESYYPARLFRDVKMIVEMQAAKRDLHFEMDIPSNYPNQLYGDKTKIREILINLLNNSVKYTREGSVFLKVACEFEDEKHCRIRYEIKDTGIGIKEEDLAHIFDSFQRVDAELNSKTEGTGLGLSIVKGYLELMGGRIWVESVYGEGSTFYVELEQEVLDASPIQRLDEARSKENKTKLCFKNVKVLAVDDISMNLKVVTKLLRSYGLEIETAGSGAKAIELCSQNDYDLVLMDQMMPVMDGVEAMKHIRDLGRGYEKGGTRKIIALTANAIKGTRDELLKEGFDDYVGKPIFFPVFERVVTGLLSPDQFYYQPIEEKDVNPSASQEAEQNAEQKADQKTD